MSRRLARAAVSATCALALALAPTLALAVPTWDQDTPSGTAPTPRVGQDGTSAYDVANDRLIVFGFSSDATSPRPEDAWVMSNATEVNGPSAWTKLLPTGTPHNGDYNHSTVYAAASNRLIAYGGCIFNCGTADSSVHVLTNANGLGGPPAWIDLGAPGISSEGHSAVYDDATNRMIVFGGQQGFNSPYNSVRVLSNADGTGGTPTWTTLAPAGTPPTVRESVAAVYDAATNRMIVMGGARLACCAVIAQKFNDVWVLTNANGLGGTPTWIQLSPTGTPPTPRMQHRGQYDPGTNRLIIFGGNDNTPTVDPGSTVNDVWVLTNANGLGGTPAWIQLAPTGGPTPPRWGYVSGYHPTYDALVVAMGRTDNPAYQLYNDAWVLGDANGVSYAFSGFFSPVDNLPTVNSVKAGAGVPVKFSLGGDQGLDIFVPGFPRSRGISCDTSDPVDGIEETVTAGSSTLTYDATTDTYHYVWKTSKSWAGTCRELVLRLDDGTVHVAQFQLRK